MEDTLRAVYQPSGAIARVSVLILVLMEDTLRELAQNMEENNFSVLILVLMEDTLRESSTGNQ